ncbi:MAG: PAS domain-containing protein [Parvibaculum sp.]|uniref:PAS domain-containing protein n=1 Tax=Parvibaculum sp. TaxID=2024848 RepID=UPI0025E6B736|nr:PAS domain-containing protein [Parvibaculum sp.]MCE9651175.1 PAS domain-containing protein [Parvibaculum sp.]
MLPLPLDICGDISAVPFEFENSRALLAYWQSLREGDAIPRAEAVNPGAMRELLPEIIIYDVPDADTVRYRLAGTLAVKRLGFEPKGLNAMDWTPRHLKPYVSLAFNTVATMKVGALAHFRLVYEGEITARVETTLLPLTPPDGQCPRVLAIAQRHRTGGGGGREPFGVLRPTETMDDATIFDLGFGVPEVIRQIARGMAA